MLKFKNLTFIILSMFFILILNYSLANANRTPLLQEGKKTLFQRVVSHPNAVLYSSPTENIVLKDKVKTFTALYVYGQQANRLEVGVSSNAIDGWIDKNLLTYWPQALTMLFTDRSSRLPVLFFKDHDSLVNTCLSDNLGELILKYNAAFEKQNATIPAQIPVLAAEPSDSQGAVAQDRFYLMPVLQMDAQFPSTKLIEVASIDPGSPSTAKAHINKQKDLNTGIVFVIDTTISMRPYIEQSLAVIRQIYDSLEESPNGEKVAFAVIAFRNSTKASPELGYTSKVISPFTTVKNRESLEKALASVREASVSTHSFNEDSLSGIKLAVDELDWSPYASRVMLMVSDAGPLAGSDPYASTNMSPTEMADYLKTNNIWLTALHIKSPTGKDNHTEAQNAYLQMSLLDSNKSSYIPINAVNLEQGTLEFNAISKALANGYRELVDATAEGKLLKKPTANTLSDNSKERARQLADISGYAMQLNFLGTKNQNKAPNVVKAWIADADLEKLSKNSNIPLMVVEPAILLTKNQLNDLSTQLKNILDQATRSQRIGGADFFQSIISAAAQLTRDPSRFSHSPGQNLVQTGVLGEFLDGLPYKSDILNMTEDEWYNKSVGEQSQFINRLRSRIARYEEYDKDSSHWESFGSKNTGDWVYRVPLSQLP